MTYFCYLICLSNNFSSVAKVLEIVLINPIKIVTSAITLCYFYFYLIFLSFCFKLFFFFFFFGRVKGLTNFITSCDLLRAVSREKRDYF